jgi:hypothetical protein
MGILDLPIIKVDFIAALICLQQGDARRLELLNSAYMTLIPKKLEAVEAKDFRPISLDDGKPLGTLSGQIGCIQPKCIYQGSLHP